MDGKICWIGLVWLVCCCGEDSKLSDERWSIELAELLQLKLIESGLFKLLSGRNGGVDKIEG